MSKKKRKQMHRNRKQMRMDFMDYESKHLTPQRFGDTSPQLVVHGFSQAYKYDIAHHLYKTNALAHRIIALPAEAATRNGWRIVIPNNQQKQALYQNALDNLQLKDEITQELVYQGTDGMAYLNVNVDEKNKTDLQTPLDPENILDIKSVNAFGQKHVRRNQICNDPTKENYLKDDYIVLDGLTQGSEDTTNEQDTIQIDHTRYKHIALDQFEDDEVGTSMLDRCYDQLKVLDTAEYSTGKMLYEYNLKLINSDTYFNHTDDQRARDNRVLKQGMSTESVVIMGLDEKMQKISTNAGGINSLYDFAWQQLSAASGIPKSILLGEQAGTLAGASQDVINFYDNVKAVQEQIIRPQLEWIVRLLMYSENVGGSEDPDSLDWHIEFKPLFSQDDSTKADNLQKIASALKTLTDAGIMGTDEAHDVLVSKSNDASIPIELQADSADSPQITQKDVDNFKKEKEAIEGKFRKVNHHGKKT